MTKTSKKPGTAVTTRVTECEATGTTIALAIEPTREGYARAIHTVCRRSAITVGQLLIAAKDRLPHGAFTAMIEEDLPFGDRTAERLMVIARHEVLSNPTHASDLPGAWTILHELALIDEKLEAPGTLEAWLKKGIVHRDIKRDEVERLVEHELARREEEAAAAAPPIRRIAYIEYLRSLSEDERFDELARLCADVSRQFSDGFTLSVEWDESEEAAEVPEAGDATIN
jgi:hypothetical protein